MSIKTAKSVNVAYTSPTSGRAFNDLLFTPGKSTTSNTLVVGDTPVHIFAAMPLDRVINTSRLYSGPSFECTDIPATPVDCASGVLSNDGTDPVYEMWITSRGNYQFEFAHSDGVTPVTEIPEDFYMWYMFDDSEEGCCNGC